MMMTSRTKISKKKPKTDMINVNSNIIIYVDIVEII